MNDHNKQLRAKTCRHFNGIMNDRCEAGVEYKTVRVVPPQGMHQWPCIDPGVGHCAKLEYKTPQELADEEKEIDAMLAKMLGGLSKLMERTAPECLHCGKHVDALTQVGRCVYAEPCGCRQYQGTVPKVWRS